MSLRTFHIVFIGSCVLLALFLAGWSVTAFESGIRFLWAGLSLAAGVLLIVYGRAFLNKIVPGADQS